MFQTQIKYFEIGLSALIGLTNKQDLELYVLKSTQIYAYIYVKIPYNIRYNAVKI